MRLSVGLALLLIPSAALGQAQGWQDDQDGSGFKFYDVSSGEAGYFLAEAAHAPCPGYTFSNNPCVGMGDDVFGALFWYTDVSAGTPSMGLRSDTGLQLLYAGSGKNGIITWPTVVGDIPGLFAASAPGFAAVQLDNQTNSSHSGMWIISTGGGSDLMKFFFTGGAGSAAEWSAPNQIIINPTTTLEVPYLGGSGTRCLQTDNSGNVAIAAGACSSGSGTVTSVNGTAGRIVVTPSSPNPVVDLATFGTASTCAWANVVTDAWGRTTCTANTAPQPAGSYITALTHDVTATGPGSAAAEVTGITDVGSVDWQVTGAFANGKVLGFVGGGLQAVSFQAPLVACTDYVSLACVTGATDLGGTNATPTVIAAENNMQMRGNFRVTNTTTPATPGAGLNICWTGTVDKNIDCKNDTGAINHGVRTNTGTASQWVSAIADNGFVTTTQPAFTDVSGQWACSERPAASAPGGGNDVNNSSGSCVSTVVAIHDASTTQLVFGTIPDSNPQNTVLIRGAGATSISGVAASVIGDTVTKHDYFINFAVNAGLITGEWAATSNSGFIGTGITIEYPNDFKALHVAGSFDLIASAGVVTGPVTCTITINGSNIAGTGIAFTPGTTANGVYTTGTQATGSTAVSDTYGLFCQATAGLTGATFAWSYQMVLTP